jgi:arginine repressor
MAKRNQAQAATTESNGTSKKQQVLEFKSQNPEATPKDIAEALSKQGVEITAAHVSTILTRKDGAAGGKSVDRFKENLKKAKDFAKGYKNIEEAIKSIRSLGQFVDACGSSTAAIQALEGYRDLLADLK